MARSCGRWNSDPFNNSQAYDGTPKWSPDDKLIAFNSDRFGNNDIFAIPSWGGVPNRLTYFSGNDGLSDWSADGNLLFETAHSYREIEWDNEIYRVSSKGGSPVKFMDALGYMPSVSPDSRFFAFVKGAC